MPAWGSGMRVADGELAVASAMPTVRGGSRAETAALFAAFLGWLAIVCVVGAHHEPWRDESDLWLFVRDAAPSEWWTYLKHQGSPGLWHLLILPLAQLDLPYASITWLNLAIVAIGVAIFLRCAPFPVWVKLLFPFSVLPLYEYGIVARSYGVSLTLFITACAALALSARWRTAVTLLFGVSLGFSAVAGAKQSRLDYREPFSASREAAEFLRTLDLDSAMVVAQLAPYGGAILPYLPIRQMWYPGTQEFGSYVHWDSSFSFGMWETPETGFLETRASFPGLPPIVYISVKPIERPENMGLTLRHATAEPPRDLKADEHFFIYTTEDVRPAPHVDRVAE